jgi:predicted GIY-YIG superfamily endonuclease
MFSLGSPSSTRLIPALIEQNARKVSCPVLPEGWCNYMLLCIDGSYYVGLTNDLAQGIQDHSSGKGPTYTKTTKPKFLVWYEPHPGRESATAREKQLKGWSRTKKHALARGTIQLGSTTSNLWLPLD